MLCFSLSIVIVRKQSEACVLSCTRFDTYGTLATSGRRFVISDFMFSIVALASDFPEKAKNPHDLKVNNQTASMAMPVWPRVSKRDVFLVCNTNKPQAYVYLGGKS